MPTGKKVPVIISFEALDQISVPLRALNKKFETLQAPVKRFQNQLTRLGKASGFTQVAKGVQETSQNLMRVGSEVVSLTFKLAAMGAAAGYAFNRLVGETVRSNSHLAETAEKTGVSVEALQKWRFVAEQTGGSAEDLDTAFVKFSKTLGMARLQKGPLVELLGKDSPFINQLTKMKSTEAAFELFVRQLGKVPDEANQVTLALAGFGKGADSLINMTHLTDEQRDALMRQREAIGLVRAAQATAFKDFNDKMQTIGTTLSQIQTDIVAALLPALNIFADQFSKFINENRPALEQFAKQFAENLPRYIHTATDAFNGLVAAVKPLIAGFMFIVDMLGPANTIIAALAVTIGVPLLSSIVALTSSVWGLGVALVTTPIGQAIIVFSALAFAVKKVFDAYKSLVDLVRGKGSLSDVISAVGKTPLGMAARVMSYPMRAAIGAVTGGGEAQPQQAIGAPLNVGNATPPQFSTQAITKEAALRVMFENAPKGMRTATENKDAVPLDVSVGYKMGP